MAYAIGILVLIISSCFAYCAIVALSVPNTNPSIPDQRVADEEATEDSLFDCQQYQLMFDKQYHSHDEAMRRCIYLLATALNVFSSGVAYRYRKQNYYLALNKFSDWSPKELNIIQNNDSNNEVGDLYEYDQGHTETGQQTDPSKVVDDLKAKIKQVLKESSRKELLTDAKRRKKRDTNHSTVDDQQKLSPRHVSINMLIKRRKPISNTDEFQKEVVRRPDVENENYVNEEIMTQGLSDGQEKIGAWNYKPLQESPIDAAISGVKSALEDFQSSLSNFKPLNLEFDFGKGPKIEMFADLRKTGCFFPVRYQGTCGSCYAFASVAIIEYLYCKAEGFLTPFSEQYMVDCGKLLVDGLEGCTHATGWGVPNFIQNYGMELRDNYPYLGRETECPYDNDTVRETTGYVRFEMGDLVSIDVKYWPMQLKHRPLYVVIAANEGFASYGGGVYDGLQCTQPNHAVVLVGHGREDGQEFWLFRNSYGADWGDDGYFKLAKSAPATCIDSQRGFVFGTKDGRIFNKQPRKNYLNDDAIKKKSKLISKNEVA